MASSFDCLTVLSALETLRVGLHGSILELPEEFGAMVQLKALYFQCDGGHPSTLRLNFDLRCLSALESLKFHGNIRLELKETSSLSDLLSSSKLRQVKLDGLQVITYSL